MKRWERVQMVMMTGEKLSWGDGAEWKVNRSQWLNAD